MKQLIVSCVVALGLAVLLSQAAAAPTTAPPARNAAIELALRDGSDTRTYQLTTVISSDSTCTLVSDGAKDSFTQIDLCVRQSASGEVQLDVDWKTESNASTYQTRTSALVTAGTPLELGGKTRRLAITVK